MGDCPGAVEAMQGTHEQFESWLEDIITDLYTDGELPIAPA